MKTTDPARAIDSALAVLDDLLHASRAPVRETWRVNALHSFERNIQLPPRKKKIAEPASAFRDPVWHLIAHEPTADERAIARIERERAEAGL